MFSIENNIRSAINSFLLFYQSNENSIIVVSTMSWLFILTPYTECFKNFVIIWDLWGISEKFDIHSSDNILTNSHSNSLKFEQQMWK